MANLGPDVHSLNCSSSWKCGSVTHRRSLWGRIPLQAGWTLSVATRSPEWWSLGTRHRWLQRGTGHHWKSFLSFPTTSQQMALKVTTTSHIFFPQECNYRGKRLEKERANGVVCWGGKYEQGWKLIPYFWIQIRSSPFPLYGKFLSVLVSNHSHISISARAAATNCTANKHKFSFIV